MTLEVFHCGKFIDAAHDDADVSTPQSLSSPLAAAALDPTAQSPQCGTC